MTEITIPLGLQRYQYFLQQLQIILSAAGKEDNSTLYFYQQNARTPLFMLEALSRIYRNIHNSKRFTKLQIRFKQLEDMLGAVDYYDGFYKEFSASKAVPDDIITFLLSKRDENLDILRNVLNADKWLGEESKRLKKIQKKLESADWLTETAEGEEIKQYYAKSVSDINEHIKDNKINFDDVETDVHELRRELRWLSIYPQALRGLMQLTPTTDSPEYLNKYLTDEVKNSSFNKMPDGSGLNYHIQLSQNYFYALSWLIAELGKLKDTGLRILVVTEALMHIKKLNRKQAEVEALELLGDGQMSLEQILVKAKKLSEIFFSEKIIDHLLV
ncbi:MAG: hypothetical protein HYR66_17405, partial [Sphingobacteriales bacterium]|nr:hypothetical protein [Sphingobacteriales bacterium]